MASDLLERGLLAELDRPGLLEGDALRETALALQEMLGSLSPLARAALTGERFSGELTLMAHYNTPYRLILEVLYTAGEAEYGKYRLLVMAPSKE